MDWRNNQWVGIGAAVALVLAIVVIFLWGSASKDNPALTRGYTFRCESTGETFFITEKAIEDMETYETYMLPYGQATVCKSCGLDDAYRSYFCPECDKWYHYEPRHEQSDFVRCPEDHAVPEENW